MGSSAGFKISARVRQSSVTSNTLWVNFNFFGQIIIQRYFVFVSTVELRTLYIQGLTHVHFQYNSRKLVNVVKVRFTMMYSSRKLNNKKLGYNHSLQLLKTNCLFFPRLWPHKPLLRQVDSKNSVLNFPLFT